jgi:hypothetical protein
MNHEIYHLRNSQLSPELAFLLSPIISAYRPHDDIPTRQQLDADRIDNSYVSMVELAKDVGITYGKQWQD